MKKIITTILTLIILTKNSTAMISFDVENSPYIGQIKVEDNFLLAQSLNQDFVILYNKNNEMIYIKHKREKHTYKVALSKLTNPKFLTTLKPEDTELNLLGYKSKLNSIQFGGRSCIQFYEAPDLQIGSSISSMFAIYKAFVYFTGQGQVKSECKNLHISNQFDTNLGLPLSIFYEDQQFNLINMTNENQSMDNFLKEINLNIKYAKTPKLKLQYYLMLSLLPKDKQDLALAKANGKPLDIQIKTISNLLKGF
jgi:hypothetical protein